MQKVTLEKTELLKVLTKNREEHVKEYTEAMETYRKDLSAALHVSANQIADGKSINVYDVIQKYPEPSNHEKDYTRVIKMLEMSVSPTVELTASEFMQYVEDEWTWKPAFVATSAIYNNKY